MMTASEAIVTQHEKEELFLQFLHSFLIFLIYVCRCSLDNCDKRRIDRQKLELSLMNSLTLMWQMHVTIFTLKTYYRKADYIHDTSLTFNHEQSELIVPQLRKMEIMIDYYPFIEKEDKRHCLSLLEQIKSYYKKCEFVIVEADLHAEPWLASSLKPG